MSQACAYADVSREAYYLWTKNDKRLLDRFEALRQRPVLKALETVSREIGNDGNLALKYLERRFPEEYADKQKSIGENPILVLLQAYGVVDNDGKLNYEKNVIDQPDQADEERPSAEDSQG